MAPQNSNGVNPGDPRGIGRRGFLASAAAVGGLGILSTRLLYLQGFDPRGIAEQAKESRTRTQVIPALRGQILDTNNKVLARSVQRYNITVDQSAVTTFQRFKNNQSQDKEEVTPTQLVYQLADILDMKDSEVKSALDGTSKYKVIKENVTPEVYTKVMDLGATFLYGEVKSERMYPNGSVGGSVVGRFSMIEAAVEGSDKTQTTNNSTGIERVYDEALRGTDGERIFEISADGIRIPVGDEQTKKAQDGQNVRLTINQDIQYFAQEVIARRVKELKAQWGTVVVMKVDDGSIIALGDSKTMDPGSEKFELEDMTPRSISQAVEPGSTEKILTSTAVLEDTDVTPTTVFDVPAELQIEGQTINDAFTHPAQKRTFSGIITDSMNTGTVLAGKKLTKEQRYNWLKKYGMGELTGIELTGESQGLVPNYTDWDVRQQYTVLFGQGVAQTPLQTSLVFQTVGNLGIYQKPRIVEAVIDPDGTEHPIPVEEGRRIISEETARETLSLMENVVVQNAKGAQITGYRTGGKTGTAQAPSETQAGYDGYTTSFFGVAPIENPQFMVSVTIQRPKSNASNVGLAGGADQFSQIMEKVLHTYKVPYSTTEPVEIPKFPDGHNEKG